MDAFTEPHFPITPPAVSFRQLPRTLAALLAQAAMSACAAATASHPAFPTAADAPFDVVIENGRIVDGTGAAWYYGDVGIAGDRIARVAPRGMLHAATARRRIDARGLVVAPGFIDIQSGSYGSFVGTGDGRSVSKITQGITTEIIGEGGTPAPLNPATHATGSFSPRQPRRRLHERVRRRRAASGRGSTRWAGTAPRPTSARSSAPPRYACTRRARRRARRRRPSWTRCAP